MEPNAGRSGALNFGIQTDQPGANSMHPGGPLRRVGPPMPGGDDMMLVRAQESRLGQSSTFNAGRPGPNFSPRPVNAPSSGLRRPTGPPPVLAGATPTHLLSVAGGKAKILVVYAWENQSVAGFGSVLLGLMYLLAKKGGWGGVSPGANVAAADL